MALARFARTTDLPLYNQPSDTDLYHENKQRYMPCYGQPTYSLTHCAHDIMSLPDTT